MRGQSFNKHPTFGNTILRPLKFLGDIREYVQYHHERWDGTGYPGLRARRIPLASRIIAVADTYDAMTSTRPYRAAPPPPGGDPAGGGQRSSIRRWSRPS